MKREVVSVVLLALCAGVGLGCTAGDQPATTEVSAAIHLTPTDSKCLVIKAVGSTTVTQQFNTPADATSVLTLTGLPLGGDTFTAQAYNVVCASTGSASATYVSDPITLTVTASMPVTLNFTMRPANATGGGMVTLDFPTPHGSIKEFGNINGNPSGGIVYGPDGNIWFTIACCIVKMTPSGSMTIFQNAAGQPLYANMITVGPDGNMWFTEDNLNTSTGIGRITPDGVVAEFPAPAASTGTGMIVAGPDGNVWFTEVLANKIAKITPVGKVTEYAIPSASSSAYGIATGSDGNLWFTEFATNKIGRITTSGNITEYNLPNAKSYPYYIAAGADGNLWFTEDVPSAGKIGRITTSGVITEFATPSTNAAPYGIAQGPDGNMWFTEYFTSAIGRITPAGVITEFGTPTLGSYPLQLVNGGDGNMWFTEAGSPGQIGRLAP